MNIKTDTFYNSNLSLNELRKIEKRLENMVRKSQGAIAKQNDWRYKTTSQHQLYKELLENKSRMPVKNKLETIQSINKLQEMLKGKGATLKGTKELIKNREASFIGKAVARGINPHVAAKEAKSKDFYDFLHSDTYKKLSLSVGKIGSPEVQAQYMRHKRHALEYYNELLEKYSEEPGEITYQELQVPEEFLND